MIAHWPAARSPLACLVASLRKEQLDPPCRRVGRPARCPPSSSPPDCHPNRRALLSGRPASWRLRALRLLQLPPLRPRRAPETTDPAQRLRHFIRGGGAAWQQMRVSPV